MAAPGRGSERPGPGPGPGSGSGPADLEHAQQLVVIRRAVAEQAIHTVEIGVTDSYGHLRGKRVPAERFLDDGAAAA